MAETRSIAAMAATNEAIASLQATSGHHNKNIQEIQKIQEIHTRTMNEMNQHLIAILHKLGSDEARPQTVEVGRVWLELPSPIILLNQIQVVLGNPIQLGL